MQCIVTHHAHKQYCERVEHIDRDELERRITEQMPPEQREREYIRLDGVWWVFAQDDGEMILVTCLGRSHLDVPAALRWARQHGDRITLGGGYNEA